MPIFQVLLLVGYLKAAGWVCRYYHCERRDVSVLPIPSQVPAHGA